MHKAAASYLAVSIFLLMQAVGASPTTFQYALSPSATHGYAIFNGSTYVNTPSSGLPRTSTARSVFAWIYSTTPSGVVYSYGLATNDEMATLYISSSGSLAFQGMSNDAQSNLNVSPNAWHLVGYTYSANSTSITFYLDGKNQTVKLGAGVPLQTSAYSQSMIGKRANCNGPCNNFIGFMAELRVYSYALNQSGVGSLYLGGPILGRQMLRGLAAWWPLNWSVLDYSGNGNAGVYHFISYGGFTSTKPLSLIAGSGGSVFSSPQQPVYDTGTKVGINAMAAPGYSFSSWSCTGIGCYSGTDSNATVTMNDNITETASFGTASYSITISANPTSEGRISVNGNASASNVTSLSHTVPYADALFLSQSALPGYSFKNWTCTGAGCYSGTDPSPTVNVYDNITEVANFQRTTRHAKMITLPKPTTGGTATGTGLYLIGSNATIFANPNPGYDFVNWTCIGTGCYSGTLPYKTGIPIYDNITEVANFAPNAIIRAPSAPAQTSGSGYLNYLAGTIVVLLVVAWYMFRKSLGEKGRGKQKRLRQP